MRVFTPTVISLTAMFCMDALSVGDVPLYRAVPFDGVIGDGQPLFTPLNLRRWPAVHRDGDGLRFRIAANGVVFGTYTDAAPGSATVQDLRAARWLMGDAAPPNLLPLPADAVGALVSDANADGSVVGAAVMGSGGGATVQAAAWSYADSSYTDEPAFSTVFTRGELDCLFPTPLDSMLMAVGPRDGAAAGQSMLTGVAPLVEGGWLDGFFGALAADGAVSDLMRLPSQHALGWCDTWEALPPTQSAFGQCVIWAEPQRPAEWLQCEVVGSARETIGAPIAICVANLEWDLTRWTVGTQVSVIEHCQGCDDDSNPEACVHISFADEYSFVTALRMGAFAPGDESASRAAALAGLIEVRITDDAGLCASSFCAIAHAAVVLTDGRFAPEEARLFDLHSVLPQAMAERYAASGIARINAWAHGGEEEPATEGWIAVGTVGNDFIAGGSDEGRHGCIWIGRGGTADRTEWCALDVNTITILPDGLVISALHDIDSAGLAVGVASVHQANPAVTRLVYLTAAADLDGDLFIDGRDLALLIGALGTDCAGAACEFDLDRDGHIGGSDLGLMLGAWDGTGSGAVARVWPDCPGQAWKSPLRRYPYIEQAASLLGFGSMDDFGATASALLPEGCFGLCATVDVLAAILEENQ